jgi:hypothetical protein
MLGTIIINTVCIFLIVLTCYVVTDILVCLVLYVVTYFNAFSLTHCVYKY